MRTKELMEAAQLHTLGLLDEDDATAFEAALTAASPGVQAQIRREQARLAQLHAVLPEVEPRAELRGMVIEAVRRESSLKHPAEAIRHAAVRVPKIVPGRRVSRLWRTAAVSLAAISMVLSAFTLYVKDEQKRLQSRIENDEMTSNIVQKLAPQAAQDVLFGNPKKVVFANADPAFTGRASIFFTPGGDNARFYHNLPSTHAEVYQLVALDSTGEPTGEPVIKEFYSSGGIHSEGIKLGKGVTELAIRAGVRGADKAIKWTTVATVRLT